MALDTTDPRASYPPDRQYVNQGSDRRLGGAVGKQLALVQRLNSFKSIDPPTRIVGTLPGGILREVATGPNGAVHLAIAVPYGQRWATFRLGHRYDANWGDGNVRGYNPEPDIVGGYIFDIVIKLRAREPFIDVPDHLLTPAADRRV